MPELPEVETMVRGIRPAVEGKVIQAVRKCRCACRPITITPRLPTLRKRTVGAAITEVRRLAKRIVLDLSTGDALVIEPRMTGLMLLSDPPDRSHLRLQWEFAPAGNGSGNGHDSLWFWDRRGLGTVRLFSAAELDEMLGPRLLGWDALQMTDDEWRNRCAGTSRPIKVALLDQKLVAGIGNLYASEILHRAGIRPTAPANRLTAHQIRRLSNAVREILTAAIRYEGSTLGDGTYRNALNQNGQYQNHHRVYGRADEPCPTCRAAAIVRIVQAQRSTFFCPHCQQ